MNSKFEIEKIKDAIETDFGEIKKEAKRYSKYFWFFPIYIIGFILIERFPVMRHYHVMHCALDDLIPFCEYFVIPYYSWHVLIAVLSVYTFRHEPERFEKLLRFFIACCFIIFPMFVLLPSCQNLRPQSFDRDSFFIRAVKLTYALDTNTNVCPSMHVIGCAGMLFTCWNMKGLNDFKGRLLQIVLFGLICLSTVFLKQHSCIDVLAAVPVSLLGWWISYGDSRSFDKEKIRKMLAVIIAKGRVFTIPNIMSFFRICLIPAIIAVYKRSGEPYLAVGLIVLSGFTDVLDGMIARRFNMVSDLGKILDPIADKLTQLTLIYILTSEYPLMWSLIIIILFKECVQGLFGFIMLQRNEKVHSAKWFGKVSTAVIYATMLALMLFSGVSPVYANASIGLCAAFLILALILYTRFYLKELYPDAMYRIRDGVFKALGILMWAAAIYLIIVNRKNLTAESIAESMPDSQLAAAFIIIGAFAVKSLTIVFPSAALITASALIFPFPAALSVSLAGIIVMASIPYFIGLKGGAAELDRLCSKHPKIRALKDVNIDSEFLFTLLLRINGAINYDVGSMYLGARGVSSSPYYLASIAGMMPQLVIYSLLGVGLSKSNYILSGSVLAVKVVLTILSFLLFGKSAHLDKKE